MHAFVTALDAMGRRTDIPVPSDTILAIHLAADTPKSVAVPAGARHVLASATGDFWMSYGRAAVLPGADVPDGSAPELNPGARAVERVATLGLVAPAACVVSLAFYG